MKSLVFVLTVLLCSDAFAIRVGKRTKYLRSIDGPNSSCVKIGPKFNKDENIYRRVCVIDPEGDILFGNRDYLRETDLNRICIWEHNGDLKIQFKTRSSKNSFENKRFYDLYLLSPRLRGFSGRSSHWDWTLDRKDKWTSYYMIRATSNEAGPKKVESVVLRSFFGDHSSDDVWREMGEMKEIEGKKWFGSEYITFKVPRKYVCPRFTTCRFKITGFAWEESGVYEVDRIPATEICLREEQAR